MEPTRAGAVMRYADELADFRVIPLAAVGLLQRLIWKYRPRGGWTACVGLDELAGDGVSKPTVIRYLAKLEAAGLIIKEKWHTIRDGRYCQMPNRYHLRTVEQAKATVKEPKSGWPLSESIFVTVKRVIANSSLLYPATPEDWQPLLPQNSKEDAQQGCAPLDTEAVRLATSPDSTQEPAPCQGSTTTAAARMA